MQNAEEYRLQLKLESVKIKRRELRMPDDEIELLELSYEQRKILARLKELRK